MVSKLKIQFADFYDGFDKKSNFITNILSKYYDWELSDCPDYLFYSCFGTDFSKYHCVRIFINGECVNPNFNECDYGFGPGYLDYGDRYIRLNNIFPKESIQNRSSVFLEAPRLLNRKFCNFIYSNKYAKDRQVFFHRISKYKYVDAPGSVLNNMACPPELGPRSGNFSSGKINFCKNYKFTIAFEHTSYPGYTTEKLLHPFLAYSIPIYWGNPLVDREFNTKAFINCNDYDNDFDAVVNRVKELDENDDEYLEMLSQPPMVKDYKFNDYERFSSWILKIIEKGNHPLPHFDALPWNRVINALNEKLKNK